MGIDQHMCVGGVKLLLLCFVFLFSEIIALVG